MQYYCKNQTRRIRVINSPLGPGLNALNGIDYLEVDSFDQKTLEIHFLRPLPGDVGGVPTGPPLALDNIKIEGGTRIQNIKVVSVASVNEVLTIQVDNAGDFSMYIFRLVASPTDISPPADFDAQLAFVAFSFKAGCPSDFDCKTKDNCYEVVPIEPRIDYLAKDYASFRHLMLDRLSLLTPDWTERNAADLQIALVEILAYTGDHLSYYQDAVATEAYLFKSRKRISARRHARLLDYHVHDGCNARTWLTFEVESGSSTDGANLPAHTILLTKGNGNEISIHPNDLDKKLHERGVIVFESVDGITLHQSQNKIDFYTWDDTSCCLPKGSTSATLYNKGQQDLFLEKGQVLILEEVIGPTTGLIADADPTHRHPVRLESVEKKQDVLNGIEVCEILWQEEDALPFPLCVSAIIQGVMIQGLSVARGNVVLADHGITVEAEKLIPESASEKGLFRPLLPDIGVTVHAAYPIEGPASRVLHQNPHQANPAIELLNGTEVWKAKRDLLASDRFTNEFVAEIETDHTVRIRFGDDILGKKPGQGFQPKARYRIGNGLEGNVGSDSLGRVLWPQAGMLKVRNPLPAQGGKQPETIEEVRQYAPEAFKTQERAVTEADYVAKTELHQQVQKAMANFRWTGSWHTVFLTIDRRNGLEIDKEFKQEIYDHLEKYRMAGYDLEIRPPVFVSLEIELNVCVNSGYFRSNVKENLLEEFSSFDLPNFKKGFFHPDEFTFGQPVYLSAIYQRAMAVEGVASVEMKTLKRQGRPANQEITNGRLMPKESEIIRLDNDPNFPENGKINFYMYGGL